MLFKDKFKIDSNRLKNWDYSSEAVYFITLVTQNRKCLFGNVEEQKMILNENGKVVEKELLKSIKIRKNWFFHNWIIMPNHIHLLIEIQTPSQSLSTNVAETHCGAPLQKQSDVNSDSKFLHTTHIVETHCGAPLQNQSVEKTGINTTHIVETHCSASTSSTSTTECNESLSTNKTETHSSAPLQNQSVEKTGINTTHIVETHRSASTPSISTTVNNTSESEFSRKSNSISSFVAIFKSITTKQINGSESIWQENYHDHIVRNYKTFEKIYNYIKHNPISWETDSLK